MGLIKPELKRIEVKQGDSEVHKKLNLERFTGFLVYEKYDNGVIRFEIEWKDGNEYGYQIEYYDNEQIKYYEQMDWFNEIGPTMAWYKNGNIKHEETDEYTRQYDIDGNITYEVTNKPGPRKGEMRDYTVEW